MSIMFEVFYRSPADPAKEEALAQKVRALGGCLDYREESGRAEASSICLTFAFPAWPAAEHAAALLRQQGEHVEGPMDYAEDDIEMKDPTS